MKKCGADGHCINTNKEAVSNYSAFGFDLSNSSTDFTYEVKDFNDHIT